MYRGNIRIFVVNNIKIFILLKFKSKMVDFAVISHE